jgi:chromosomal replication initiator protein
MSTDSWQAVLVRLRAKLDPQTFDTWFRPTRLASVSGDTLHVAVPNEVFRDWLSKHYGELIQESLQQSSDGLRDVAFVIGGGAGADDARGGASSGDDGPPPPRETTPAGSETPPAAAEGARGASLNPKYTFASFVVGTSNQFAHAAARAVAEAPSRAYNPLFIYGGVGLGKTHLMHAIGHHVRDSSPSLRIVYLSSERFMNELINSIRYDRTFEFRNRYRNIDVLLMDDIQFLAGKERTQEEFFHTFNALYDSQRQIVVTSDSPPKEIPTLEERLQSRFEWGLLADIQPPDLETKIAILKKKAELESPGQTLPDDVLLYIGTASKSNIRELEGALIRLLAYSSLTGQQIELSLAKQVLRDTLRGHERVVTIDSIQRRVAEYYGLRPGELTSRSNARRITLPRQVAMYLTKNLTRHSLPEIGRAFGGKHHSTVIHSIRRIDQEIQQDPDLLQEVTTLRESFQ